MKLINCNQPHPHQSKWNDVFYSGDWGLWLDCIRDDDQQEGLSQPRPGGKEKERVKKVAKQLSIMAYKKITYYKRNNLYFSHWIFWLFWNFPASHLPCLMLVSQETLGRGLAPCSLFLALQPPTVSKMHSLACCLVLGGGPLATVAWLIQRCWSLMRMLILEDSSST